ncbi:hypothetical protein Tco_1038894, partial [Tanacetum coccineum]
MSSSSSTSYRRYNRNQDVTHRTHCDCDPPHPIPIQTAWTIDNPGRRFRGCPIRDKSKKCGVYGFLDLELPSDYYKSLVYNLHEENKALKKMNKVPGVVMEDSSNGFSNKSNNENDLKADLSFVKSKLKVYDRLLNPNLIKSSSHSTQWVKVKVNIIVLSSDSEDVNDGPSKGKVPKDVNDGPSKRKFSKGVKDGPPTELLRWYGYADVSSSDSFPFSTDEETSEDETTNNKMSNKTTGKNLMFYEDTKYIPVG